MRTGFLILNYETYWETENCVRSILDTAGIDRKKDAIVIVDNGSSNDSFQRLADEYKNQGYIYVLKSASNLGFAKGNNIGFRFCKQELNCDFIVMINSDILFVEQGFSEKLTCAYQQEPFAVAGPDVRLQSGEQQNPQYSKIRSMIDVDRKIMETERRIRACESGFEPFTAAFQRLKNKALARGQRKKTESDVSAKVLDIAAGEQLHGCFLIFSPQYIQQFDGLYDRTFLYGEETLLRMRCERAGMKMAHLPQLHVQHRESRTEKFLGGGLKERHLRRFQNTLDSLKVIKNYMENENIL